MARLIMSTKPLENHPPDNDIRVLVVADDHSARAGLAALLAAQPGCTVVGQVAVAEHTTAGPDVYDPDVAVWDLGWDPTSSLDQLSDTQDNPPPAVVLAPDESSATAAWRAGARGVLPRDADGPVLLSALAAVAQGLAVLDPELAAAALPARGLDSLASSVELTPRELEVLGLMAEGLPNKSIAHRLDISEHTAKFHVNSILTKLGAESRTEAAMRATRMGLITL